VINPFRKTEPAAPPEPPKPIKALAPRPTLEAEVRAVIWQKMSPELCAAADVSWSDLHDWIMGDRSRLTPLKLEAVARQLGLLTTPVSALGVIREALEVRLGQHSCDWGPSRLNRVPDIGVNQGEENPSSAAHVARLRAFVNYGEIDLDTLNGFVREKWGPSAYYDPEADLLCKRDTAIPTGPPPGPWTGGSNVPGVNQLTIATLKRQLKALEAAS
jgi:hypothetical protein